MADYPADPFASSRAHFDTLVGQLQGPHSARLDHADLERMLVDEGWALMRQLTQDHLDLRAVREEPVLSVRGADGHERTQRRPSSRPLGVVFGTVIVRRLAMVRHGVAGGLRPLDAALNLPCGLYSHGVRRRVCEQVAVGSYNLALATVHTTTASTIAKRQAEQLAVRGASDFEDFYNSVPRRADEPDHLLVLTTDAKGIVMRPEALRAETKKRAVKRKAAARGRDRRTAPDPRRHRKRMAQVASVYALAVVPRTPDEVMSELSGQMRSKRPKPANKRVWASVERSTKAVLDEVFLEGLLRAEHQRSRRWVALVDGDWQQIETIEAMAVNSGVEVTIVVDLLHVIEYLWECVRALHEPDTKESVLSGWVSERARRILRGGAGAVAAGMRRAATARGLSGTRRETVDRCAGYLRGHQRYLQYDAYLRDGLPIATGVIEGACRSLVGDRMGITGARWGLSGAEAVLKLRSLRASEDFDAYWAFHERRELERNHLDRYDDSELSDLRMAA